MRSEHSAFRRRIIAQVSVQKKPAKLRHPASVFRKFELAPPRHQRPIDRSSARANIALQFKATVVFARERTVLPRSGDSGFIPIQAHQLFVRGHPEQISQELSLGERCAFQTGRV